MSTSSFCIPQNYCIQYSTWNSLNSVILVTSVCTVITSLPKFRCEITVFMVYIMITHTWEGSGDGYHDDSQRSHNKLHLLHLWIGHSHISAQLCK